MSNKIVVGTRGSILALAQAEKVKQLIEDKYLVEIRDCQKFLVELKI